MSQTQTKPTVIIIGRPANEATLRRDLGAQVNIVALEMNLARAMGELRNHNPDIALLFMDEAAVPTLDLTRQISGQGGCVPIVVSANKQSDNILQAMRAGARDFAYVDDGHADVLRAIRDLHLNRATQAPPKVGKVITVFGAKGGSGATTLAVNLAHALRLTEIAENARPSVVLLDFDRVLGDVLLFLDLTSKYSYQDVLDNIARLDGDLIRQSLTVHSAGFHVLAESDQPGAIQELGAQQLDQIVNFLSQHFDFVIIDGLRDFGEAGLVALDRADTIMCLMTQDIPSLKYASRCLRLFDSLRYPSDKVKLVVNRYRNSGRLTADAVADALSRRVDATIYNDFPTLMKCVNEGKLLFEQEPGSRVAKDFRALAGLVHELPQPKKRGLFARWGKA
jgi:pilus assembly protein CpaE